MIINFKNKNILFLGSAGLIGKAVCKELAKSQANMLLVDVNPQNIKFSKELKIKYRKQNIIGAALDVSSEKNVIAIHELIKKKFDGKIHGLVHCIHYRSNDFFNNIADIKIEELEKIFSVNVFSIFLLFKHLHSCFIKAGGASVVNFSSTFALVSPNFSIYEGTDLGSPAPYTATKGALHSLTRYLACYYAKENIRVNSITPHAVANNHDKRFVKQFSKLSPLGRLSEADEVAPAVLFLLSQKSSYITGANLKIDGGWTAW